MYTDILSGFHETVITSGKVMCRPHFLPYMHHKCASLMPVLAADLFINVGSLDKYREICCSDEVQG